MAIRKKRVTHEIGARKKRTKPYVRPTHNAPAAAPTRWEIFVGQIEAAIARHDPREMKCTCDAFVLNSYPHPILGDPDMGVSLVGASPQTVVDLEGSGIHYVADLLGSSRAVLRCILNGSIERVDELLTCVEASGFNCGHLKNGAA